MNSVKIEAHRCKQQQPVGVVSKIPRCRAKGVKIDMKKSHSAARNTETLAAGEVITGKAGRVVAFLRHELFVDSISCLLLSAGLTMALTELTVLEGGIWKVLGLTAISLLILLTLRIRWWLAPASAGAILAGTAIYYAVIQNLSYPVEYWSGFLLWARQGAPAGTPYSDSGILLLEASLAFVVALAVFILIRRLFVFPLVLGVASTVIVFVYVLEQPDLSAAICFAAAGLFELLPRVYAGYVRRNSDGAHNRGSMQLMSIPAALLALLLANYLVPEDTGAWRSKTLYNFMSDLNQFIGGPFSDYPAYASNFSLAMVNFQPDINRLGGPVTLNDDRVALVNAEQPVLLRGSVRDYYTGESWWLGAPDGDFRYESLFWRKYRRETYDLDKPADREAARLFDDLTRKARLDLTYVDNRFATLFAAGRVQSIIFPNNESYAEPFFNTRGELYLRVLIPVNTRVTIETTLWQPRVSDFDESFLRLEQLTAPTQDPTYDKIYERYTQLPATLPASVQEMSDAITLGIESPYEKARAIESWLKENCTYTLQPDPLPQGDDFVAHFLKTRQGYCSYYASAMAVLARCAGLPSRYVTGFALERNPDAGNGYQATGQTAHAWTEIYFRGIGWMEFDPLAWDAGNPLNSLVEPEQAFDAEQTPNEVYGYFDETQTNDSTAILNEADGNKNSLSVVSFVLAVLGIAVSYILIRLALRAIMTSKLRAFRLDKILRRFPDTSSRIEHYYADILRQLGLIGLEPRSGETLATFPTRVDRRIIFEGNALAGIAEARMRLHFAGKEPTAAEVESAFHYHHSLELLLRERLGGIAYFFRRALKL